MRGGNYQSVNASSIANPVSIDHDLQAIRSEMEKSLVRLKSTMLHTLPRRIDVVWALNPVGALMEVWKPWVGSSELLEFGRKFGPIDLLMHIEVDYQLLNAAIQFWDPEYKCFTFNEDDLSPTVEEYEQLLEKSLEDYPVVYFKRSKATTEENMKSIIGESLKSEIPVVIKEGKTVGGRLRCFESTILGGQDLSTSSIEVMWTNLVPQVRCFQSTLTSAKTVVSWFALRRFIQKHRGEPIALDIFALALYGLLIFPRIEEHVDAAVVDLFERMFRGVNPFPAIIAEIIRALNACRKHNMVRFTGCAPLLFVWMQSHFKCVKSEFTKYRHQSNEVLMRFLQSTWPARRKQEDWESKLRVLRKDQIVWKAPWNCTNKMLYKVGSLPWVPLIGIWGIVVQAPVMFLRQMGAEQFVPAVPEMLTDEFDYGTRNSNNKARTMKDAWMKLLYIYSRNPTGIVRPSYTEWLLNRGKPLEVVDEGGHLFNCELSKVEKLEKEFEKEKKSLEQKIIEITEEVTCLKQGSSAMRRLEEDHQKTLKELKMVMQERDVMSKKWAHMKRSRVQPSKEMREEIAARDREFNRRLNLEKRRNRELQARYNSAIDEAKAGQDVIIARMEEWKAKYEESQREVNMLRTELETITVGWIIPYSPKQD